MKLSKDQLSIVTGKGISGISGILDNSVFAHAGRYIRIKKDMNNMPNMPHMPVKARTTPVRSVLRDFPFAGDRCPICGYVKEFKYQVNCPVCLRKKDNQ